ARAGGARRVGQRRGQRAARCGAGGSAAAVLTRGAGGRTGEEAGRAHRPHAGRGVVTRTTVNRLAVVRRFACRGAAPGDLPSAAETTSPAGNRPLRTGP